MSAIKKPAAPLMDGAPSWIPANAGIGSLPSASSAARERPVDGAGITRLIADH
jgi:hypothetical protein